MSRLGECESAPIKATKSLAKPFSSVSASDAIRTAIVTNTNTGDKVAASLSSRIAARKTASRKGKGRFEAKAAAKVDENILEYLDFLDDCTTAAELREAAEESHRILARVTKIVGGENILVQPQDGGASVRARIPGHLRAKGKVTHKRQKAHVFGVGDVVIVDHGDIIGKFDSPALLAHLESSFRALGFAVPSHFFAVAKDAATVAEATAAGVGETWDWDYSSEVVALDAKRTAAGGGAAATASRDEEEIDIDDI